MQTREEEEKEKEGRNLSWEGGIFIAFHLAWALSNRDNIFSILPSFFPHENGQFLSLSDVSFVCKVCSLSGVFLVQAPSPPSLVFAPQKKKKTLESFLSVFINPLEI